MTRQCASKRSAPQSWDPVEFFATEVDELAWKPFSDGPTGMWIKILAGELTGDHTRLVRADPGLTIDSVRKHEFWEETYVLNGGFFDHRGYLGVGSYTCYPPGSPHGPYRSPEGWLALEVVYHERTRGTVP